MHKKEIEIIYKKKIKLLKEYNRNYYDNSNPLVTDKEYDDLKKDVLLLEKNHKFLNSKSSPSERFLR